MRYLLFIFLLIFNGLAMSEEKVATLAGGCFWCVEADLEKLDGVDRVISGYTGGEKANPAYEEVSSGTTGHVEAVQVYYDPDQIGYDEILDRFWQVIDPTDDGGQFSDRGKQYRSAIFYHNEEQKKAAEESKNALDASGVFEEPIVTEIRPLTEFYPAEKYHQDYYKKNSWKYKIYRILSGRDRFIESKKEKFNMKDRLSKEDLKKRLTPLQYRVTQEDATEPAFDNAYWDNKVEGIYVDIVSGEPLFSSKDKFESGTGWPSFTKPLEPENIVKKEDASLFFQTRTEVRSKKADSHLGHVFEDGPPPSGLRYCINSASLRFIPVEDLEKEGYEEYLPLFENGDQ